ncbi:MAG: SRPBCC family protein [Bacteroidetes bacterium]|jgi:carbon monoxide dehydrogenase subunit G|nr:SRPBCC family protein [Bacteroidota bacterium]
MVQVESRIGKMNQSIEKIYNFLADFNNFSHLIPEDKIKDWQADNDSCAFTLEGVGHAGLRMIEKEPHKLIKIQSEKAPISFFLWIQLKSAEDTDTRIKITVKAEVNAMMAPMLKSPLQQFVDTLVDQAEKLSI